MGEAFSSILPPCSKRPGASGPQAVTTQTCLIHFPASPLSSGAYPATHREEQPLKARIHFTQTSSSVTYRSYKAQWGANMEILVATIQALSAVQSQLSFFSYLVDFFSSSSCSSFSTSSFPFSSSSFSSFFPPQSLSIFSLNKNFPHN